MNDDAHLSATDWEGHSDAALLCALSQQDLMVLLELHRRHAPQLYALAQHMQIGDPERCVQEAWLFILRHAQCQARTSLEARVWIIAMAQRSFSSTELP